MSATPPAAALALALLAGAAARANPSLAAPPPAPAEAAAPLPSRTFPTPDVLRAQRLAIAALQDLGLALESADAERGTLTASRLDAHALRLTVTITAEGDAAVTARVAADYAGAPIADPRPAERFFEALARQLAPAPGLD